MGRDMSMPVGEERLVDAYVRGQVTRRTFIRRLVTAGLGLTAAMTYADLLHARPAMAGDLADFYDPGTDPPPASCTDFYEDVHPGVAFVRSNFQPSSLQVPQGGTVQWRFGERKGHWVLDHTGMFLYSSGPRYYCDRFEYTFIAAGVYDFICADRPENHHQSKTPVGTVTVPLKANPGTGPLGTSFRITWASVSAPVGFVYDVQTLPPGATKWSWFRRGTSDRRADVTPQTVGEHRFRARLRRPDAGAQSRWRARKITVT